MKVSIIAAVADNRAIGKDNDLIWHLPRDMRYFKESTEGHHVIMGRMNYESIPHKYRPLPKRPNIIITRQKDYIAPGCTVVSTLRDALEVARRAGETEAFIIGGGQIYDLSLQEEVVDTMYITHVHASPEADVFFPEFNASDWQNKAIMRHETNDSHQYAFDIVEYSRHS